MHSIRKTQTSLNTALHNPIITGTLLLTAAGIVSRIIGFFYRIFLSRTMGAEHLGLYQLTFPLLALCLTLTSSGLQTALSKFVAQDRCSLRYFYTALVLSVLLALGTGFLLLEKADVIASLFLGDPRCAQILRVMSLSLVPAAVHACVNGYYFGQKKASVPSISQLLEQLARVGGVYVIWLFARHRGTSITAVHAMWGIVIGESFGMIYSWAAMTIHTHRQTNAELREAKDSGGLRDSLHVLHLLLALAIPLTLNRVILNLCTSVENMLIPRQLTLFGLTSTQALSVYGVLTGMTLSIIFFPNVLANSLSVMLLPAVSEASQRGRREAIRRTSKKAVLLGLLLGGAFTVLFFLYGERLGILIFDSPLAGQYIKRLSGLCPFMYIAELLNSVLHGLGRAKTVLFINLMACLLRILFILLLVPRCGMDAYLWSLLLSQLFAAFAVMIPLRDYMR